MPSLKKTKTHEEVDDEVLVLVREQIPKAFERARADRSRISATWVATGDSLALLVCNTTSSKNANSKIYRCRVLDVITEKET
jgi:hypothetical protein